MMAAMAASLVVLSQLFQSENFQLFNQKKKKYNFFFLSMIYPGIHLECKKDFLVFFFYLI